MSMLNSLPKFYINIESTTKRQSLCRQQILIKGISSAIPYHSFPDKLKHTAYVISHEHNHS